MDFPKGDSALEREKEREHVRAPNDHPFLSTHTNHKQLHQLFHHALSIKFDFMRICMCVIKKYRLKVGNRKMKCISSHIVGHECNSFEYYSNLPIFLQLLISQSNDKTYI